MREAYYDKDVQLNTKLLIALLEKDPTKRPSASDALQFDWFAEDKDALKNLLVFNQNITTILQPSKVSLGSSYPLIHFTALFGKQALKQARRKASKEESIFMGSKYFDDDLSVYDDFKSIKSHR